MSSRDRALGDEDPTATPAAIVTGPNRSERGSVAQLLDEIGRGASRSHLSSNQAPHTGGQRSTSNPGSGRSRSTGRAVRRLRLARITRPGRDSVPAQRPDHWHHRARRVASAVAAGDVRGNVVAQAPMPRDVKRLPNAKDGDAWTASRSNGSSPSLVTSAGADPTCSSRRTDYVEASYRRPLVRRRPQRGHDRDRGRPRRVRPRPRVDRRQERPVAYSDRAHPNMIQTSRIIAPSGRRADQSRRGLGRQRRRRRQPDRLPRAPAPLEPHAGHNHRRGRSPALTAHRPVTRKRHTCCPTPAIWVRSLGGRHPRPQSRDAHEDAPRFHHEIAPRQYV